MVSLSLTTIYSSYKLLTSVWEAGTNQSIFCLPFVGSPSSSKLFLNPMENPEALVKLAKTSANSDWFKAVPPASLYAW